MSKLCINLPTFTDADDYHDFEEQADLLSRLSKQKVRISEVGFDEDTRRYLGILYAGKKPSTSEIKRLASVLGIVMEGLEAQ